MSKEKSYDEIAHKLAEEGVKALQEQMANLYKNRDHIADAGKMVEVEKKCGTCKWYEPMKLKSHREGFCNYPLPPLPISFPYSYILGCGFVEPHYECCPVWEGEE